MVSASYLLLVLCVDLLNDDVDDLNWWALIIVACGFFNELGDLLLIHSYFLTIWL